MRPLHRASLWVCLCPHCRYGDPKVRRSLKRGERHESRREIDREAASA